MDYKFVDLIYTETGRLFYAPICTVQVGDYVSYKGFHFAHKVVAVYTINKLDKGFEFISKVSNKEIERVYSVLKTYEVIKYEEDESEE